MSDPGALSATFVQVSNTSGLGSYALGRPIRDKRPLSEGYPDGSAITYHVTDDSGTVEVSRGVLTANTLTRVTLVLSSTGAFVDWPAAGQRVVTPLVTLPICITPPVDGQALLWDADLGEWCPGDLPTPPAADCSIEVQNVDTGVEYTVTITECETQIVWNSTDIGEKLTHIPAATAVPNKVLHIKANVGDVSVHCVLPDGGTVGGLPSVTFEDNLCDLSLISNAAKSDWLIRCLCCYTPMPCEVVPPPLIDVGAVFFDGTAPLWNFPAMADSSTGILSYWVYVDNLLAFTPGVLHPGSGDLHKGNSSYIVASPSAISNSVILTPVGSTLGTITPSHYDVSDVSSSSTAVITFVTPHGIRSGSWIFTRNFNQSGWFFTFNDKWMEVLSVTSNTVTVNFNTTGFPTFVPGGIGGGDNGSAFVQVANSTSFSAATNGPTSRLSTFSTESLVTGQWVNVLRSWDVDHASGAKVSQQYFGDTLVPDQFATDDDAAFVIPYSNPDTMGTEVWTIGGTGAWPDDGTAGNSIIAYMAEIYFAPGQYLDFSTDTNRQKFHDAATGKPVDLGLDGSDPTGLAPAVYLTLPVTPDDAYTGLSLSVRLADSQDTATRFTGSPAAGSSHSVTFSFWKWGDFVETIWFSQGMDVTVRVESLEVVLRDPTGVQRFNFNFDIPVAGLNNIRFTVDTDHTIGSKIVNAYVNNSLAAVTVTSDTQNNMLINTNLQFSGGIAGNGFVGTMWVGFNQFFDISDKFVDGLGAPTDLGSDGSTVSGTTPVAYFNISGSDPAEDLQLNRGSGGTYAALDPDFYRLLPDAFNFLKNSAGGDNLHISPYFLTFTQAPTSPSD